MRTEWLGLLACAAIGLTACQPGKTAANTAANASAGAGTNAATAVAAPASGAGANAADDYPPPGWFEKDPDRARIEAAYTKAFHDCSVSGLAAQGVEPAMTDCDNAEYDRQDKLLNAAYQAALAKRSPADQEKLRQDERAWIKAREALCMKEAQGGGQAGERGYVECLFQQAIKRRFELEK